QPKIMTGFEYGSTNENYYKSYNTLSAKLSIPWVEDLSIFGSYSFDYNMNKNKIFETPFSLYSLDEIAYKRAGNTGKEDGTDYLVATTANIPEPRLSDNFGNSSRESIHLRVNYSKVLFNDHNISAFVAYE